MSDATSDSDVSENEQSDSDTPAPTSPRKHSVTRTPPALVRAKTSTPESGRAVSESDRDSSVDCDVTGDYSAVHSDAETSVAEVSNSEEQVDADVKLKCTVPHVGKLQPSITSTPFNAAAKVKRSKEKQCSHVSPIRTKPPATKSASATEACSAKPANDVTDASRASAKQRKVNNVWGFSEADTLEVSEVFGAAVSLNIADGCYTGVCRHNDGSTFG